MVDTGQTAQITVDIATRVIGDSESIHIVRAGASYWLYREMRERQLLFLEFPDLELDLAKPPVVNKQFREQLVRSEAISDWHKGRQRTPEPPRDIEYYGGKAVRRRLGRYAGAVRKLFYDLPEGAIVAMPGPGYLSEVMVGVISGPPYVSRDIDAYRGEPVTVRPVKWLGGLPKGQFPAALRERIGTPNPTMEVRGDLRGDLVRVAFDQYILDGKYSSRLFTQAQDFSSLDDEDITSFINYIAGALEVNDRGGKVLGTLTVRQAKAALRENRDRVPELGTNINSPGFLRLFSPRIDPLVISVVIAVVLAIPGAAQAANIQVVNSASPTEQTCSVEVSDAAREVLAMMTLADFNEECKHFTEAAKKVDLKVPMKVKARPKNDRQ